MKKNDIIIVVVLVVMMFAWMNFYPGYKQQNAPQQPVEENVEAVPSSPLDAELSAPVPEVTEPVEEAAPAVAKEAAVELPAEEFQTLENDQVVLTFSSHGGAVVSAVLKNYPELNEPDSPPVMLDFAAAPAMKYDGLPPAAGTFVEADGGLVYTAPTGEGQVFKRTLKLTGEYLLTVQDEFVNQSDTPWALPELRLPTGPMAHAAGASAIKGIATLGVDSFTPSTGVTHWGKKFGKMEKGALEFTSEQPTSADWIAVKNKFFVQILTAEQGAAAFDFKVRRESDGKRQVETEVSGALQFEKEVINSGESFSRSVRAYIGPKDFDILKTQGMEQTEVMEFKSTGFWKFMNPIMYPIKLALLWGLVHLAPFGSTGIAILILTIIVRVIFWPLTHKSTESMKRMQELQPQMQAIKEKYKDNPQRMQQETMLLYRENKVNPMGGCLPMFIQIPVFIALYRVLQSAIELRYSKFLWISDLSEPENLFAGKFTIPLIGWDALNILPLLMAATMMWQQKLTTPSAAATPEQQQQQKMMQVMMPIMMLFFFYAMPSGLVLYWTTSQMIMIVQMLVRKKKEA